MSWVPKSNVLGCTVGKSLHLRGGFNHHEKESGKVLMVLCKTV